MAKETERELSIERQINQKSFYFNFHKFKWNFWETLIDGIAEQLNPTVKESGIKFARELAGSYKFSGSFMEGAAFARNLNPNFHKELFEGELDIMFPLTKILRNRSREVIVDLEYAKGFAWIKYKPECFDSREKLDRLLIKHEDGNTYLNSKAVKELEEPIPPRTSVPDLPFSVEEMIEGPSCNVKMIADGIKPHSEATAIETIRTMHECVRFIENVSEHLKKFHCAILLKLKELEKFIEASYEFISTTDVEELASRVLPMKKEKENLLLKVHWMSLAFINETLSAILTIDKMLPKKNLLESLGMLRILYHLNFVFMPLSNPKELFEGLNSYFKYLLYSMPKEVYEKYERSPVDGLSYFLKKSLYIQQGKMEKLFQVFSNCKSNLSKTCASLKFFHGHIKDELDVNDKISKLRLSLDKVPAIVIEDFPYIASEWVTRDRKWPSLLVIKEIAMSGCHIVPKPYYGEDGNNLLDWRWSFSLAEMILASVRTRKMDTSYLILKSIFYKYLKPIECGSETLASYFVKTVMLWQCEENDETWWSNESTVKCVSALLNKLKASFYNKHLSHYFIREINLLDNVADELVLYGQAILESICVDPIACIGEILEFYPDVEETDMSNETIAETGLECKLNMPLFIANAQEELKVIEKKYEDQTQPKFLGGAIRLFKIMFEELMPKLFRGVPTGSFSEENYLNNSEINFDDLIKTVESGFSEALDIPLD